MPATWDGPNASQASFSFLCKGGQNDIVGIIGGGGQVRIHVQNMWQTRGVWGHAPPENFGFGPFIRHNLGLLLHKHNLPFIVSLKPFDLHVK